jgi:hypothetical protein
LDGAFDSVCEELRLGKSESPGTETLTWTADCLDVSRGTLSSLFSAVLQPVFK